MTGVVGVHGVGNFVSGADVEAVASQRSTDWAAALARGLKRDLPGVDLAVAYWAPLLRASQPTPQGAPGQSPDDALDQLERLDPETRDLAEAWLDALDLPAVVTQGRLAVPLRHALSVAADRFSLDGRLTKLFVALCFPEVSRYLRSIDNPARLAVREHVAGTIAARRPRIVIAHSLGTIIAYEVLHAHPELQIDLLITLGSPLALPRGVFEQLNPAPVNGAGERPPNVKRWVNISDHGDPVAILRPFDRYFPGVDLDLTESVGLFDFHRVAKYLASASVAATLAPYL